ncbi:MULTISPECIES: MalY/PatB family protein [Neobacillus]|uniref:cysteine-S-conjugate beta-lyase n=1 Tax=Neobacillus rhizophilus TaxID=2833579 RepID=A0A942UBS9_9BACI|nr:MULTISPECIES: MalY/PatB family protein [Neobacillus]MBS4214449.1 pyridoxal phosphate-dependent aminotransferase [Neobacillus rhizophilus]MBU8918352.1 pyridoxal phosphate-dependent aminotransferase [Bacillus sp. FJAT-29953]
MKYNFDIEINRHNTASAKWDETENLFGEKNLLPMWVADMDFQSPAPVIEAIIKKAEHGIFGYTTRPDSYYRAIIDWMQERYNWSVQKEWICYSPGVVPALNYLVQTFTNPGDKIVIQPPVYYPFTNAIVNNNRQVVYNQLKHENGNYSMDLEDLRDRIDENVKMLILCNPHNPSGRVWTKDELTELGKICIENNILIVSDEIHCDLVFKGKTHTVFASISEEFAEHTIVCTAPSKTFNLAGLQTSNIIIPNQKLRDEFNATMNRLSLRHTNTFGIAATESAYRFGGEWLEQVVDYIEKNLNFLSEYMENNIKEIKVIKPEASYLVWLDCRELGLDKEGLKQLMLKHGNVAFNQGYTYGPGGEGFIRMNIGCPRSILEEGLRRLEKAVKSHQGTAAKI